MNLGIQIKNKFKNIVKIFFVFLAIFFSNKLVLSNTVIGALNKVSGKISKLTIEDQGEIFFGSLKIIANTCKKSPPEEPPENYAFLEIWEVNEDVKDKTNKKIFSGWMFSSSPSISALEHAVYDIWIIDCNV
tara:strand:+ start:165 stop:560 length:396 start_codon:yes stop_codon:yes gene_type:complete